MLGGQSTGLLCKKRMKRKNIFIKILKYLLIVVLSLLLVSYILLNLFIKSKEIKVDKNKLINDTNISLTDEQIKIACLVLYDHMNPEFHNYFFLINDAFSNRNNVALNTADFYIGKNYDIRTLGNTSMNYNIITLATKRYVMKNIDYRFCYNYVFSFAYFGNQQYGLQNASEFYYSKNYKDLTSKEFINLCLLLNNPHIYNFLEEENKIRCEEKVNEIYLKFYFVSAP